MELTGLQMMNCEIWSWTKKMKRIDLSDLDVYSIRWIPVPQVKQY